MNLLFEGSLLVAPIYHALVVSQSSIESVQNQLQFFFPNKSKLEDAAHKHQTISDC